MTSRNIPEPIKRLVRQQCKFGCAICGSPVFQYDHINDFSEVQAHEVDNLVLLCPNHHNDKTTGKLTRDRVQLAKTNPFNAARAHTSTYKIESSTTVQVFVASNTASSQFPNGNGDYYVLWASGTPLVTIHSEDGWLCFSARLTDQAGNVVLCIDRGEMVLATKISDFRYEGSRLRIVSAENDVLVDLTLTNELLEINQGQFLDQHADGYVASDGVLYSHIDGNICQYLSDCEAQGGRGGWGLVNSKHWPPGNLPGPFNCLYTRC